jgi:hypothetical protein
MFFIPLSQIESVDLVVHALRSAGGEADCSTCPARRVCMKQCLTIADAVVGMVSSGTLPRIRAETEMSSEVPEATEEPEKKGSMKGRLQVIK